MDELRVFSGQIRHPVHVPTPTGYVGPGNIVSGALSWWGMRAYSNAAIGTNAVRIRRDSDNTEQDFVTLSDGQLDRPSIVTFLTSTTGAIVKFYDQAGGGRDQSQATSASQASVNLSGIGSLVTADFAASHKYSTSATLTRSQPFTASAVYKCVNNGVVQTLLHATADAIQLLPSLATANSPEVYSGLDLTGTASDGSFHAVSGVCNGASSDLNIDGSPTTGNAGTNSFSSATLYLGSAIAGTQLFNGSFCEIGIWPAAFSSGQSSSMSSNDHAFWGF